MSTVVLASLLSTSNSNNFEIDKYKSNGSTFNTVLFQKNTEEKDLNNKLKLEEVEVTRVIDGDTFECVINGKTQKVRLIGVDTPESVHPDKNKNSEEGKKASDYTKEKLQGKKVGLEYDVQKNDKYGRILAYVWNESKMYNLELLEKGYAKVMTIPPNIKYSELFLEKQKIAQETNQGFWNKEGETNGNITKENEEQERPDDKKEQTKPDDKRKSNDSSTSEDQTTSEEKPNLEVQQKEAKQQKTEQIRKDIEDLKNKIQDSKDNKEKYQKEVKNLENNLLDLQSKKDKLAENSGNDVLRNINSNSANSTTNEKTPYNTGIDKGFITFLTILSSSITVLLVKARRSFKNAKKIS
ncbi:thermonuclease family protein [Finegoldia magna]|uniref:thermonuclease family protein n=1 Tax=Finegoldia magna TaxID=1260 RepID=UPI00290E7DDB|nr:thermonuclease family protein [Finegoldia magna]MDU5508172.1 thermonuclease family protein [Finegoldia magna]